MLVLLDYGNIIGRGNWFGAMEPDKAEQNYKKYTNIFRNI